MLKKWYFWALALGLVLLGTSMHFVHHIPMSERAWHIVGYVYPVCESCWEHMKMVFYPMLVLAVGLCVKERSVKGFGGPIAAASITIPTQIVLFYLSEWLIGYSTIADIVIYWVTMIACTWLALRWSKVEGVRKMWVFWACVAVAWIIALAVLTYHYPDIFLFIDEGEV